MRRAARFRSGAALAWAALLAACAFPVLGPTRQAPAQGPAAADRMPAGLNDLVLLTAGKVPRNTQVGLNPEFRGFVEQMKPTPASRFEVRYHGFPDDARRAFQEAVDVWQAVLKSPVPVVVDATWRDMKDPNTLGGARPADYAKNFRNAPLRDTLFPIALANKLAGTDLKPGAPDIIAEFNSAQSWHMNVDPSTGRRDLKTPRDKYSFMSTVMHEIGHGLGFKGYIAYDPKAGVGTLGGGGKAATPLIYDRFTVNKDLEALSDGSAFANPSKPLGDQLVGDALFFYGPKTQALLGEMPKLEAPPTWEPGRSYSHLDEREYPAGDDNSLMTPVLDPGETVVRPGVIAQAILGELGW